MEKIAVKKMVRLAAVVLALALSIPAAGAYTTNREGEVMIRVGLASSDSHVPTGELESANLENNNSQGYGEGFRFGYYDSDLDFVELACTSRRTIAVSVLKTQNLYVDGNKYTSSGHGKMVGCYHLLMEDRIRDYDEAQEIADWYDDGFVAWIDGEYQVRAGSYATKEEAEDAQYQEEDAIDIVGTSSYGMSVVETGTNHILFQFDEGSSGKLAIQPDVTGAEETRTWFDGWKYRGGFQYHRRNGGNLTVVNVLPLEDYITGVNCYEMGREWPLEALKAQALCARTYALKGMGKHSGYGFDICNSASCQVYHGMGSNRSDIGPSNVSIQAVRETEGQVVLYNGKLAETLYSSSFGGASEDAANVWGTDTKTAHPYLRGVVDPYEADLDDRNSMSSWTVTWPAKELASRLQGYGYGVGASIDFLELKYSELGNVIQLVVHWNNGQSNSFSPSGSTRTSIRSVFDVKSIRFTVNNETVGRRESRARDDQEERLTVNGGQELDSLDGAYVISGGGSLSRLDEEAYGISGSGTVFEIGSGGGSGEKPVDPGANQGGGTVEVSASTYVFQGGGLGHQLGMSQYGANAMARRGFTGEEIVEFYFPGVRVGFHD